MMVNVTKVYDVNMINYTEQLKVVYPRAEEELIDFLNICKLIDSEVILFPRCNAVFD